MRRRNGGREGTRRSASNLLRCRAGVVALEFALLGPVTIFTIILGITFLRLTILEACLHDALVEAARYGATGEGAFDGTRQTNIVAMLNSRAFVTPTLTMTPYASWANLTSSPPVPVSGDAMGPPGDKGEVVVYTATYADPLINSMTQLIPGATSPITLVEQTVVQNEPYFSAND